MKYSPKTIAEAIYAGSRDKDNHDLSVVLDNAVLFLKKSNMLSKSKEILSCLQEVIDREEKLLRVRAESTEKIPPKLREELEEILKKKYRAKMVEAEYTENKGLIGGMKLTIKDEVIDFSFRNKLEKLQAHLIRN